MWIQIKIRFEEKEENKMVRVS